MPHYGPLGIIFRKVRCIFLHGFLCQFALKFLNSRTQQLTAIIYLFQMINHTIVMLFDNFFVANKFVPANQKHLVKQFLRTMIFYQECYNYQNILAKEA